MWRLMTTETLLTWQITNQCLKNKQKTNIKPCMNFLNGWMVSKKYIFCQCCNALANFLAACSYSVKAQGFLISFFYFFFSVCLYHQTYRNENFWQIDFQAYSSRSEDSSFQDYPHFSTAPEGCDWLQDTFRTTSVYQNQTFVLY